MFEYLPAAQITRNIQKDFVTLKPQAKGFTHKSGSLAKGARLNADELYEAYSELEDDHAAHFKKYTLLGVVNDVYSRIEGEKFRYKKATDYHKKALALSGNHPDVL